MIRKYFAAALLTLIFASGLYAQDKGGTAGLTFLKIDVSARAMGMAGSFIGLADDASALYYNPAGIINIKNPEVTATYYRYAAEINYSYIGAVYPLPAMNASLGLQGSFLSVGEMTETTPDFSSIDGTGRTFGATDFMLGVTYAQTLTTKFNVGGTVKLINENLAGESVYSVAGDVSTYYNTEWKSLIFGMSIRNFGSNYSYITQDDPIPMLFAFGVAFTPYQKDANKLDVLLEAAHPSDNAEYLTFGLEYSYNNMFFLRLGRKVDDDEYWLFKNEDDADLADNYSEDAPPLDYEISGLNWMGTTFGLGFKMENLGMTLDYGFKHMGDLGLTHMMTFGYEIKR